MTSNPKILVISAASGTGKSTLSRALVEHSEQLILSVSHTTRGIRHGEVDGRDYHFVSHNEFESMVRDDEFIEYACVYGYYYGTAKQTVQSCLDSGNSIVLEIDWQGAQQIADLYKEAVLIFLLPPSLDTLLNRLIGRSRDSQSVIESRYAAAKDDLKQCVKFDYWILNDDFQTALRELQSLLPNSRPKVRSIPVELLKDFGIAEADSES